MGTASRNSSASRSRSPRDLTGSQAQNIPEMFRAGRSNMAPSRRGLPHSPQLSTPPSDHNTSPQQPPHPHGGEAGIELLPPPPINLQDLRSVADDIKETLYAAISELRLDMRELNDRVHAVECSTERQEESLHKITTRIDSHTLQMRDMQRHLEDLDNRGRRHNLRIRGLPESFDGEQVPHSVVAIFNNILQRPPHTPIEMERLHRALRPKGRENETPRDVICCIVDYKLKEDIIKRASGMQQILHEGHPIQIYQDLSGITLQHRRDLKPLLDALRDKNIVYKWKFPFCLTASSNGRTAALKVPEDLPHFCSTLGLPLISVPLWYAAFRPRPLHRDGRRDEPMETQSPGHRRHRSPSILRNHATHRPGSQEANPAVSPRERRARRGR